ncbi:MAG: type II toxin-antitoxin system prevent-host-death family antitoxin [Propionibacteriaceae bacterium]|jgi:prevent-host-death family protein|nr:type II toxin-antitoxin system prevent-host-death family antitoxin [Propionibacteriaceae bacterium]
MTVTVGVQDAKTQLSKLIRAARDGEEVIISSRGVPYVQLTPIREKKRRVFDFIPGGLSDESARESLAPLNEDELRHWGIA